MKTLFPKTLLFLAAAACVLGSAGCRQKERVLDVETPGGGIKVDRDKKSGEIDIKVEDKK